jgi:hypothetical protein
MLADHHYDCIHQQNDKKNNNESAFSEERGRGGGRGAVFERQRHRHRHRQNLPFPENLCASAFTDVDPVSAACSRHAGASAEERPDAGFNKRGGDSGGRPSKSKDAWTRSGLRSTVVRRAGDGWHSCNVSALSVRIWSKNGGAAENEKKRRCQDLRGQSSQRPGPGVDVFITIFGDFRQFSAKLLAFFSKAIVMVNFSDMYICYSVSKTRQFFAKFFGENIFRNHNIVPRKSI